MKFTLDFRVHATASLSTDCFGRLSRDRAPSTMDVKGGNAVQGDYLRPHLESFLVCWSLLCIS